MQIFFVKVINNFIVPNYSAHWSLLSHMLVTCDPSHRQYKGKNKKPHIQIICGFFYNFFLLTFVGILPHRTLGHMDIQHPHISILDSH
jgi:hypothetical protein